MLLYHGTSLKNLLKILSNGSITPRKGKGNWSKGFISRKGFVYLTDTYPLYFAYTAAKGKDKPVILEIEVDESEIYPDEDFIRYNISKQMGLTYEAAEKLITSKGYDIECNKKLALDSLRLIGSVCYKGPIPMGRIKRVCVLNDKWLVYNHIDHVVANQMGHMVLKPRYQALLSYLFNNEDYKTSEETYGIDVSKYPEMESRAIILKDMARRAINNFIVLEAPFDLDEIKQWGSLMWRETKIVHINPR